MIFKVPRSLGHDQGTSINKLTRQLMELVLQVVSGEVQALNETHGYRGISMLKDGATL
jgi:altronate dehydratase